MEKANPHPNNKRVEQCFRAEMSYVGIYYCVAKSLDLGISAEHKILFFGKRGAMAQGYLGIPPLDLEALLLYDQL